VIAHIRLANAIRARAFRLFFAHRFARFGRGAQLVAPLGIEREDRIEIGDGAYIAPSSYLAVRPGADGSGRLIIGEGCKLGRFNHIYATGEVRLGRKVLTANGVYISDNLHGYSDPDTAIMDQPLVQTEHVSIGEGCWIGHNACVVGASLGRNCVVGANAVVTKSAPDHCVLVGAPARIVRRYDPASTIWRRTHPDGSFSEGRD
jgi:acetyltransferase-like isoleucine patch superfamily enzyme